MREATGGVFLYYIVIFILTVIILMLVAAIGNSKTYRAKNRLVDIIEKYECYEDCEHDEARTEINHALAAIGYRIKDDNFSCASFDRAVDNHNVTGDYIENDSGYAYCVYKIHGNRGPYYKVVLFSYFDVPLINFSFRFPVYGTTKSIYTRNGEVGGGGNS